MAEALVAGQFGQLLGRMRDKEGTQKSRYRFLRSTIHAGRISGRIAIRPYDEVQRDLLEAMANHAEIEPLAQDIASILVGVVSPPDDTESKKDIRNTVDEMEEYLQNNYIHPISSEVLAGVFGYVPSYLSKVFRQIKGITPSEYLVRLRVDRARELWRENPDRLVKDIAEEVGYNDQYYFSKVFKKESGQGPKDYQRSL